MPSMVRERVVSAAVREFRRVLVIGVGDNRAHYDAGGPRSVGRPRQDDRASPDHSFEIPTLTTESFRSRTIGEQQRRPGEPPDEHHIRPAGPDNNVLPTGVPQQVDSEVRGDDGTAEGTNQQVPSAVRSAPVFVDTTGRRRWRIRLVCYVVLAVVAGYSALIGISLLGGPVNPGYLVPFPDVLDGQDSNDQPDTGKSEPSPDRQATPTNTGPATSTGRSRGTTPSAISTGVVVPPATTPTGTVPTAPSQPAGHPTENTPTTPGTQPTGPDTNPTNPDTDPTTPDTSPTAGEPMPSNTQPAPELPDAQSGEAPPPAGAGG